MIYSQQIKDTLKLIPKDYQKQVKNIIKLAYQSGVIDTQSLILQITEVPPLDIPEMGVFHQDSIAGG